MTDAPGLVALAASIDDYPTLEQVDAMLAELASLPRSPEVTQTQDELLEIRSLLMQAA